MHTILITGGAGFIGGNFTHFVLEQPDVRVINLDVLTYAGNLDTLAALNGNPRHLFIRGDINNAVLVKELLTEYAVDAIVNFAAESHVDRSIDGPAAFVNTNMLGTFNLLDCARAYWIKLNYANQKKFRFLHISTDEVYGSLGATGLFTELTPYAPNSPYSASKAASDHLVRAWFHTYGLPVLTTNCSNNYGPYQFPEKLIPLMILKAQRGEPLPIYGDGGNVRDWLFVLDHCRAIWRVLEAGVPGEVYNVGGNSERTNLEVVDTLCTLLDELLPNSPHRPHVQLKKFVIDRPGHDRRYAIDASKLKRELGWQPIETFESGMRRTVIWYLEHPDWCARVMDGSYRGERLGMEN
ncbi:dTDP-glucose 4,6-dehydratase [Chromatium okenii]|uniref:dTDP-glucose 4,6-dehydratase n=1 Tax=Chromatium okenii TaxID=61644 RepID=UPI0026E9575E|nr:dTDP-glucose 4,6-dehydratase [Chromatium okenii]MBV5310031.1 dTDP-glucose 4,6-dehydratase [Chromatium okenii]